MVLLLLILVFVFLVSTWIQHWEEGIVTVVSVHPARWCSSPLGVVPVGSGDGVSDCHDAANLPLVAKLEPTHATVIFPL